MHKAAALIAHGEHTGACYAADPDLEGLPEGQGGNARIAVWAGHSPCLHLHARACVDVDTETPSYLQATQVAKLQLTDLDHVASHVMPQEGKAGRLRPHAGAAEQLLPKLVHQERSCGQQQELEAPNSVTRHPHDRRLQGPLRGVLHDRMLRQPGAPLCQLEWLDFQAFAMRVPRLGEELGNARLTVRYPCTHDVPTCEPLPEQHILSSELRSGCLG
mmetsp:Transcript_40528/g.128729  ORF Transcript_40528/g.128729 Transcript_40528/m.128729 type:complete len:217 (+) Transcript_40528:445-1095(+)